jgi:hypothetical protein
MVSSPTRTKQTQRETSKIRINVYSQELTKEIKLIGKVAADTGITYWGARMYLASPDILHHTEEDDDRSAITFWIPNAMSFTKSDLASLFADMAELILEAPDPEPND